MWWDATRIEATVTWQFVCDQLLPDEIQKLDRALGFGDGLTDGTYWEWIRAKAPRIFLILVDLGAPDQIFNIVDDSWDDDDLPIALDQIERLALTATRNGKIDRRFYYRQFHYLIRTLEKGGYCAYSDDEVIPLDILDKRPVAGLSQNHSVDKVELPNYPGEILSRRRIPVGPAPGMLSEEDFLWEVNYTKHIQNNHLVSYFASYTHQGFGYVLFTPASDYNLKTILGALPAPLKALSKQDRRVYVMNWIHCLVDTLCYLHNRGWAHGQIKPSTVLFNSKHHIFFTDLSRLSAETLANSSDKAAFDKESYIYAAPEQWFRPPVGVTNMQRRAVLNSPPSSPPDEYTFSIPRHGSEPSNNTPHVGVSHTHAEPEPAGRRHLLPRLCHTRAAQPADEAADSLLRLAPGRQAQDARARRRRAGLILPQEPRPSGVLDGGPRQRGRQEKGKDAVFRGVAPLCKVVARMLSVAPQDRPTALEVVQETYKVLRESGVNEPHCVHQYGDGGGGLEYGMSGLRISGRDSNNTNNTSAVADEDDGGFQYNPPVIIGKRPSMVGSSSPAIAASAAAVTSKKANDNNTTILEQYKQTSSRGGGEKGRDSPTLSGFEAIQNIRVNKVRNWQAPAYAGT
ncbi:protein kinase [Apiospora kogelbergensis]|uniref:protein kinase n=1 Tax=Apiospora kogelbergensis TaxID=1337665 RepID=UPI0031311169